MKQLGELCVGECMTSQTVCIGDTDRLTDAIRLMDTKRLSVLPVMDEPGRLVGILSASDLIEITHEIQSDLTALTHVAEKTREFLIALLVEQGDTTLVRDVMTSPVDTTTEKTNLVVAARKLTDRRYHHLPVVDPSGNPIGILSTSDFVRAVAEFGALLAG